MRKVVSLMHISLDGYVCGPNGEMNWIRVDDEAFGWVDKFIDNADTGFYGPVSFQMMESYWPGALHDPNASGHLLHHAQWYDKAAKIVFSRKLKTLENPKAVLVNDHVVEAVERLKAEPGNDLMIFGSPGLVHSLVELNLVDEFVMTLNPVVLGGGTPMFPQKVQPVELERIASHQFQSGSIGLHYRKV